jgi:hypothetical protein
MRLLDISWEGSSEAKYEFRFAGGTLNPVGLLGDMV